MTPELSRRIARAIHRLPDGAITLAQQFEIGPASQPHDRFEDLPAWVRDLVEAGERTAR